TKGQLEISNDVSINGPDAGVKVSRDASSSLSRIFYIDYNKNVSMNLLTMTNGRVSDDNGGAIFENPRGSLTLTNCTVSNNSATGTNPSGNGGGILAFGTLVIDNCLFEGNSATNIGGGLLVHSTSSNIINSTFQGNFANLGGGLEVDETVS